MVAFFIFFTAYKPSAAAKVFKSIVGAFGDFFGSFVQQKGNCPQWI